MCTPIECLQAPCNCFSFDQLLRDFNAKLNPFECAGVAHNEGLRHIQGRNIQGDLEGNYAFLNSFLAGRYNMSMRDFLPWASIQNAFVELVRDGHLYYSKLIREAIGTEKLILEQLEVVLLNARSVAELDRKIDKLVRKILGKNLDRQTQAKLLGLVAIAKHSVKYWNSISSIDFFNEPVEARRGNGFWADVAGFAVGVAVSVLVGSGNVVGNGVTVATLASEAARK